LFANNKEVNGKVESLVTNGSLSCTRISIFTTLFDYFRSSLRSTRALVTVWLLVRHYLRPRGHFS